MTVALNANDAWAAFLADGSTASAPPHWTANYVLSCGSTPYQANAMLQSVTGTATLIGTDAYGIGYFSLTGGVAVMRTFTITMVCSFPTLPNIPVFNGTAFNDTNVNISDTSCDTNPGTGNPWFTHASYPSGAGIEFDDGWRIFMIAGAASHSLADMIAAFPFNAGNNVKIDLAISIPVT